MNDALFLIFYAIQYRTKHLSRPPFSGILFTARRWEHCCTYAQNGQALKSLGIFHLRYLLEIILYEKKPYPSNSIHLWSKITILVR